MKITIYSDVICPFCYIGKTRLDNVLKELQMQENVEYVWKAYLLNPNGPSASDKKMNYRDYLTIRKHATKEQISETTSYILSAGKSEGIDINYDKMIPAKTIDAHRVSKMAHEIGKEDEAQTVLMKTFFTEGKDIENVDVLVEAAKEIGLDENKVRQMLDGDEYLKEVFDDFNEAQRMQIEGVPHFIVNDKYAIHGAQSREYFIEVLKYASKEEESQNINKKSNGGSGDDFVCNDEFCEVPKK